MRYVTDKYGGHEHVAQIITFGTIGAKAAIRDSGRIYQYPYSDTDKLAKFIPEKPVGTTLRDVLRPRERLVRRRGEAPWAGAGDHPVRRAETRPPGRSSTPPSR